MKFLVMPTLSMTEADKDYSVCFALPTDTKRNKMIYGRQSCDTRKLEGSKVDVGNPKFGGHEALVVFDNVFVPNDRILCVGNMNFLILWLKVLWFHRQSYGGCKVG